MATNIVRKGLNQRWTQIRHLSRSDDEFDRTAALAHSVAALEMGLLALGWPKKGTQGVQGRLTEAIPKLSFRDFPASTELSSAFSARNEAVHKHAVPSPKICQKHVVTFQRTWNSLRRNFVTREHAGELAAAVLDKVGITHVFLFGSLAHRSRGQPRDIDLLLFDEGEFSAFGSGYGGIEPAMLEEHLHALINQHAVHCGW